MCTTRRTYSLQNLPLAVNGLALADVGIAVMLVKMGYSFHIYNYIRWLVYIFSILGVSIMATYIVRIVIWPVSWTRKDLSSPAGIASIGAFSIATCLLGKIIVLSELDLPRTLAFAVVIVGCFIQTSFMLLFFYRIFQQKTLPEPFFNIAIHSSLFPPACLPGGFLAARVIRDAYLYFGLITLPIIFIIVVRVLRPRNRDDTIVANNPSIAVLQASCAIACTSWHVNPLTKTAVDGVGEIISNVLFGMSVASVFITLFAMFSRRQILYMTRYEPTVSALTFPFINSAIASITYIDFHHYYRPYFKYYSYALIGISSINTLAVNALYFYKLFYVVREEVMVIDERDRATSDPVSYLYVSPYYSERNNGGGDTDKMPPFLSSF